MVERGFVPTNGCAGGGGGSLRIIADGAIEKGVNFSAVEGELPEAFAKSIELGEAFVLCYRHLNCDAHTISVPTVHANALS